MGIFPEIYVMNDDDNITDLYQPARGAVPCPGMHASPWLSIYLSLANTLLWDVPGNVLAAPASALCGWIGVVLSLSLSPWLAG